MKTGTKDAAGTMTSLALLGHTLTRLDQGDLVSELTLLEGRASKDQRSPDRGYLTVGDCGLTIGLNGEGNAQQMT